MKFRILHHDHCFDGAASAAFFTRFQREVFHPKAEFDYVGLAHKASQLFEDHLFDGDENAIVDFKYSTSPRLTWWFDHHQSAFLSAEDAEHFHRRDPNSNKYYDPGFRSCTKFIDTVARERFGYQAPDLAELVRWADIVDGAQYNDAREAVELKAAATQLTLVIEGAKGHDIVREIILAMQTMSLEEILAQPRVRALFEPLYERHLKSIDIIHSRAVSADGVVFFDLTPHENMEGYNKFVPYYLFPESVYTVSVSVSSFRTKVSVGSNPWAPQTPKHNLATICERYGGGGHARVGAISFPIGAVEEAQRVAAEITEELKR